MLQKASSVISSPFKAVYERSFVMRLYGHKQLLPAIQFYSTDRESNFVNACMPEAVCEQTLLQLNMVYMHTWLLKWHLARRTHGYKPDNESPIQLKELEMEKPNFIINTSQGYDFDVAAALQRKNLHVHLFTNEYDELIHEELKRAARVISHSLTGHFQHGQFNNVSDEHKQQLLQDIVFCNILNETTESVSEQEVARLALYLSNSVKSEVHADFVGRILNNGQVDHLLEI